MKHLFRDDSAQVHMIEMITLFWLFFLAAAFVIQLQVPDTNAIASDASLRLAAEDAHLLSVAIVDEDGSSTLENYLEADRRDEACTLILEQLPETVTGNCWLAVDSGAMERAGDAEIPPSQTLSVMHLKDVDGHLWTIGVQVWHVGGGI